MPTFIQMQDRIADEMARDDLGEHVRQAILDSINRYSHELFFVNRRLDESVSTVSGTRKYSLPSGTVSLDQLYITVSSVRYKLREVTIAELLDMDLRFVVHQGIPQTYATMNDEVWLYPTPDGVYPLTFLFRGTVPAPSSDDDGGLPVGNTSPSYFWMTTAERMIRTYAKGILYRDVLKDEQSAQVEFDSSAKEYSVLLQRTGESVLPDYVSSWDPY